MFHLCHADLYGFTCHKMTDGLLGSFHHVIEFLHLIVGKRKSGQRDKHISGATLKPGVACQHIVFIALYARHVDTPDDHCARRAGIAYLGVYDLVLRLHGYAAQQCHTSHQHLIYITHFHLDFPFPLVLRSFQSVAAGSGS